MKKLIIIFFGILILFGYVIHANSQTVTSQAANKGLHKLRTVTGKIIAIDKKTREVTIRVGKANEEKKFFVNAEVIKSLKINEMVIVRFEVGSNVASHAKVITKPKNIAKK